MVNCDGSVMTPELSSFRFGFEGAALALTQKVQQQHGWPYLPQMLTSAARMKLKPQDHPV